MSKPTKRHRGSGEGHIGRRGDGRWEGKVSVGWRGGKRVRKSVYGPTRAIVRDRLAKILREHAQGLPVSPEREKLAHFLERWLKQCVKPSVRPLSFEQYSQHARLYLTPELGHIELGRLNAAHIQAFINRQLERLSARTVQFSLVTLKRALRQAQRWDLVVRNVGLLVDAPRARQRDVVPLNPEQSKQLLAAAKGERNPALWAVLLCCGLRESEALALGWEHVDFERRTLAVERSLARVGRKSSEGSRLVFQEPKTAGSRRVVHLLDLVVRRLREHRARQAEQRLAVGPVWQEQGLVFATSKGTPINQSELHRQFKKLLVKACLPLTVRVHDLRHSTASLLLNLGIPLKTIQSILGHSSIRITSDLYSHLAPQMMRDAADILDRALEPNG